MAIKVTVSQVAPSKEGLRLGLIIEHEKAGWMRFATTLIAFNRLNYAERQMLIEWLEDAREDSWNELTRNATEDPLF